MMIDLGPSTTQLAALVSSIPQDRLDSATPCAEMNVGQLRQHISDFAVAFTAVAQRRPVPDLGGAVGDLPEKLARLADAWRDPAAWTGTANARGLELTGEVAGAVALDEVVVHGWDLAGALGCCYEVDDQVVEFLLPFVQSFAEQPLRPGIFGPAVEVPADAPPFDRLLGLTGRDPSWRP